MLSEEPKQEIKEQFYVNARLNFAVKHPLAWQKQQVSVSSPEYRADTVNWLIKDPKDVDRNVGGMQVRSTPIAQEINLAELLNSYLLQFPGTDPSSAESMPHPAGKALILQDLGEDTGRLIVAIRGENQDFIIAFRFPSNQFSNLHPIIEDILDSFTEIIPPAPKSE